MTTDNPDPNSSPIAALHAEIAALEEELADTTHPRTRTRLESQIADLRAELAALEPRHDPPASGTPIDQSDPSGGNTAGGGNRFDGDVSLGDTFHGPVIHGDIHSERDTHIAGRDIIITYNGADAADVAPLLRVYLSELSGTCSRLSLADVDSVDPHKATLDLHAVYVGLEVTRQIDLPPEDPQEVRERAITLITRWGFAGLDAYAAAYNVRSETALAHAITQLTPRERQRRLRAVEVLAEHPRLVITGAPGSGKSSFVSFVSICLAKAWCGEEEWLTHLGADWPHGRLIPVRVVLREFAAWLTARPTPTTDPGVLWTWLEQGKGKSPLLVQHLQAACADGQAVLLLDGLDEVPTDAWGQPLRAVITIISALARGGGRCVVTCRVRDYERTDRQLSDWPVEQIAPLSAALRNQLIRHWFDALEYLKRPTRGHPGTLRDGLIHAIQVRPELHRLDGNPLLVTMMIRLQAHDGDLPGEQVTLYRRGVDLLLLQWRRDADGRTSLSDILTLPQWSESHLNRLLDRLAYAAHERGVSGDGEQGADLPSTVAIQTARQFFASYDPNRGYERAERFVNYISAHGNGIIQRHDHEIYRFPHRTFQEYLAGRRLISDEGWPDGTPAEFVDRALACTARGPQWREAVLLAVSQHTMEGRLRPVISLAEDLLKRYRGTQVGSDLMLATDVLREVGRERVCDQRPDLWDAVRAELGIMLRAITADRTAARYPVAERVRAGFLLGELGDDRMPVTVAQWQTELAGFASGAGEGYVCRIPAGDYRIGSGDDDPDAQDAEKPQHTVTFSHDYGISRFPITNAQWLIWVAKGGTASRYADDDDVNHPNQPVVGVTWDDMNAFCTWLTTQVADALPEGAVVRLPSEAEWEAAARGREARRYPWGNDWRNDSAAMDEDRQTRGGQWTVPVGCYPTGEAACGAMDFAGNVWEWTLDRWHSYPGAAKPFTQDTLVVARGGGFNTKRTYVRCGARDWSHPGDYIVGDGFRVVVSPPLAHMS